MKNRHPLKTTPEDRRSTRLRNTHEPNDGRVLERAMPFIVPATYIAVILTAYVAYEMLRLITGAL